MKLNVFEKIIRKVVREEIDYALRREIALLKEELSGNKPIIKEKKEDKAAVTEFRQKIQQQMPSFNTGNGTLDSLLSETALTPTPEDTFIANDPVNQFINKDYSELMTAMDKKKEHYRP
jgi:hypothetical protein